MIPYTGILLPLKVRLALKLLNFIHLDKEICFPLDQMSKKSNLRKGLTFSRSRIFLDSLAGKSCQALETIGRRGGGGPGEDARGGVEPYGMLTSPPPPPPPAPLIPNFYREEITLRRKVFYHFT